MSRVSLRALLCAALLFTCSLPLPAQSSTPISGIADPLWQLLLTSTADLPAQIDSLTSNLQTRIDLLATNNEQLLSSNADLLTSNSGLQDNNNLLTQQNADLQNSLEASARALATSEQLRLQLKTQLDASTQSITRAQADAKALEIQVGLLKVGCWTFGVGCAGAAVYEGGRVLKLWK
jgi:hypothetical protein